MTGRRLSAADEFIARFDQGLRTVFGRPETTERPDPATQTPETVLEPAERDLSIRLMRINHAGEVAAQGLYQGQALTAKLPEVRAEMERAAQEENDHLVWCEHRLEALGGQTSRLNPLWYTGSVAIGALAGAVGDQWSLGFVAETERQVEHHLDGHLQRLPEKDAKSRAVLQQMREDEIEHGETAQAAGGASLPAPVRHLMGLVSKVMTRAAYYL